MIEIAALWVVQGKGNKIYFRGKMGNATLLMFKNEKKSLGDNQPDYRLFVASNERREGRGQNTDENIPF